MKKQHAKLNIILVIVISALTYWAWLNRFVQDDAFISFRYAHNFVSGHGLVYNPGEIVEGYTNFLWTLLISGALYLHLEPISFLYAVGMLIFPLTLFFTYKTASLVLNSRSLGILTIILLGTNYSFSAYATGGLETQLQACLFVAAAYYLLRAIHLNKWEASSMLAISLLLTAAILTRLDSILIAVAIISTALFYILRDKEQRKPAIHKIVALIVPVVVIIGLWFAWKLSFYGDILPNTFYAKASSITSSERGFVYICMFAFFYWLYPLILVGILAAWKRSLKPNNMIYIISAISIIWLLYILKVGGDFMEFRFFVPIMPFMFTLIVWLVCICIRQRLIQVGLIAIILAGSYSYYDCSAHSLGSTTGMLYKYRIETIPNLYGHLKKPDQDWEKAGKVLGRIFHHSPDVTIAISAAGAIPYYSELKTIDTLGLNDKWVARHGMRRGTTPGHQRSATYGYLVQRKVNLLIVSTRLAPKEFTSEGQEVTMPKGTMYVEIPINKTHKLVMLYITKSPLVDRAIKEHHLATIGPK